MIRIAFPFIEKNVWAGGYNYLLNLFYVISLNKSKKFQPILFYGTDINKEDLNSFLKIKNIKCIETSLFNKSRYLISLMNSLIFGSDKKLKLLFNKHKIDVVFENANFFGKNLNIPAIAWIPDFQHKELSHLFSFLSWWKREIGFRTQISSGRTIMLSSTHSQSTFKKYYPKTNNLTCLVRFAVLPKNIPSISYVKSVLKLYSLPDKYFYMPNQFWRHKNHMLVLQALIFLKEKGHKIVIVSSGKQIIEKDQNYFKSFYKKLTKNNLGDIFILLGSIPYEHVLALMIGSKAVLNPSLYEGRSTTVEESLALSLPLILSDIKIHKEQAEGSANFFSCKDFKSLSKVLIKVWNDKKKNRIFNKNLHNLNSLRVKLFSDDFDKLITNSIKFYKKN